MKKELSEEQLSEISKKLDETIDSTNWESSSFLKIVGSRLKKIKEKFTNDSKEYLASANANLRLKNTDLINRIAERAGQKLIFISIYNSDGQSLNAWEKIIHNITKQYITRPIYNNEEDISNLIKSKVNKINEAYISVYVSSDSYLNVLPEKLPKDKLGKKMILLKDNVIKLENIVNMIHIGNVYNWEKNKLVISE